MRTMSNRFIAVLATFLAFSSINHIAVDAQCCSQNFRDCDATWCGSNQIECDGCETADTIWLGGGALPEGSCLARWGDCTQNITGCCQGLTCEYQTQHYSQCTIPTEPTTPSPTEPPTPPPPTATPTTAAPTVTASPTRTSQIFSCSEGEGKATWEAALALDDIVYKVSSNPITLSVIAEGGAAGDGSKVVSESQGYGLLTAALAILSMKEGDANYNQAKERFEGFFNGWKKMCFNSNPPPCQSPVYCDGMNLPCLPGWKHEGDLSSIVGTGAAPDGDEDAIVGMIIAVKSVEQDSVKPSWYDEVRDWADRSCTQFLQDNTKLSSSGEHRLVKLGSCWGGWNMDGNNPSYHGPGHYRTMRDFQASVTSRAYSLPNFGDASKSLTDHWNMVIDTSYKFFETTQCPDTGLVPNWALVREVSSTTLAKQSGDFSASNTPQREFGSEASRTMWRVAFDAAAYPEESQAQSIGFLEPLYQTLVDNFNDNNSPFYFGEQALQDCSGDPDYVQNVFGGWQYNGFIYGPVYSTLVGQIPDAIIAGKSFSQEDMVDRACEVISNNMAGQDYFSLSWLIISMMTLNGENFPKLAQFFNDSPTPPAPIPPPTLSPVATPTDAPVLPPPPPTDAPVAPPTLSPVLPPPPPTDAPVAPLTNAPITPPPPTDAPITPPPPTDAPVALPPPTDAPVTPPPPTDAPVTPSPPTDAPVMPPPPTTAPVTPPPPTDAPVTPPPPTDAPVMPPPPTTAPVTPPLPTDAPVAPPPPTQARVPSPTPLPTSGGSMCCSNNLVDCMQSNWCNQSQGNCQGSCNGFYIDVSANSDCTARWGECTDEPDDCCFPAECGGNAGDTYRQCNV